MPVWEKPWNRSRARFSITEIIFRFSSKAPIGGYDVATMKLLYFSQDSILCKRLIDFASSSMHFVLIPANSLLNILFCLFKTISVRNNGPFSELFRFFRSSFENSDSKGDQQGLEFLVIVLSRGEFGRLLMSTFDFITHFTALGFGSTQTVIYILFN